MASRRAPVAVAALAVAAGIAVWLWTRAPDAPPALAAVGPRLVSNRATYALTITGEALPSGARLVLGPPASVELPTRAVDERHLVAVLPPVRGMPDDATIGLVEAKLVGPDGAPIPGAAKLAVANDAAFPQPLDLAVAAGTAFVVSPSTDELFVVRPGAAAAERLPVGDEPRAVASFRDAAGAERVAVVHASGELRVVDAVSLATVATAQVGPGLEAVTVEGGRALVTDHVDDLLRELELPSGRELSRAPSGVNPRAVARLPGGPALVSSFGTEDLVLHGASGRTRVAPGPGTPIVGGHTEGYAAYVMGGKAARDVVASARLRAFFASGIGPSIGPNPDKMEVSMNGGVSVIDEAGRFVRHVSLGQGLPEGLALDDARGLLFAADVSRGRVVVLDAARLVESDEASRGAVLGALALEPRAEAALIRPAADFGGKYAGTSVHVGPWAVALDGATLVVLCRLDGTVRRLDTAGASRGVLVETGRADLPGFGTQPNRRLGEIVFHTDVGGTRMTCDACHPGGHVGGVIYEKTRPIRIYRAPSLRASRDTAPYFTPSMLPSLRHMSRDVLGRNRFHDPEPTPQEIAALASYNEALAPLPNPYREGDGGLPRRLALPDGREGDAVTGLALFEGKGGCLACHPPPQFTLDQDEKTRGQLLKVGTPLMLPLRPEHQDPMDPGWPPASLVGAWDTFPLLQSGAGGLEVEGGALVPKHPFALRRVLELPGHEAHGAMARLSERERDDLLAYLLTL